MKLSKVLFSSAVAAALVFGFAGCADGSDDPNEMITGRNSEYFIDYVNEDTNNVSRGYHDTAYNHCGAAIKITFEKPAADPNGVMGFMFDLKDKDGIRSFNVVGLRTMGKKDGKLNAYVSGYKNVTDIQANNFGAPSTGYDGNGAKEIVYVKLSSEKNVQGIYDENSDSVSTTIYACLVKATESGKDSKNVTYEKGSFVYKVYALNKDIKKLGTNGEPFDKDGKLVDLSEATELAIIKTDYQKYEQAKLAVYANVYKGKALAGSWKYCGDFKETVIDEN